MTKQLQEKKTDLAKIIRQLAEVVNTENRDFTDEERSNWDQVNADYNVVERQLETASRVDRLDAEPAQAPAPIGRADVKAWDGHDQAPVQRTTRWATFQQRDAAVEGILRINVGLDEPEDEAHRMRLRDGLRACNYRPGCSFMDIPLLTTMELSQFREDRRLINRFPAHLRAAGQSTAAGLGAEFIPEGFVSAVEKSMLAVGALRQVAGIIRTATGNDLPWPTVDDTGTVGRLLTEETAVTQTNVVTGSVTFNAYKYTSDLVLASPELLQDEAVNMPALIGELLGERMARIMNQHFTTGTGSSQPNGFVTQAIVDNLVLTAGAGVLVANDLITLMHSVDPAYRSNASFMLHDNIVGEVRKLTVSDQGYVWQPSLQVGDPDRLLGHPMRINQDMDSDAAIIAGEEIVAFGDFSKYKIREVAGIRFRRLTERYADTDQEGFISFMRADGDIPDRSGPIAILRVLA